MVCGRQNTVRGGQARQRVSEKIVHFTSSYAFGRTAARQAHGRPGGRRWSSRMSNPSRWCVVYSSADPAFGRVDAAASGRSSTARDCKLRGNREGFLLSEDVATVRFGLRTVREVTSAFSLAERRLDTALGSATACASDDRSRGLAIRMAG